MTGHAITAADVTWARGMARFVARSFYGFDIDEAEAIALLAIAETAPRWKSDGGASFRTLAFFRIRGAIVAAWRDLPGHGRGERNHRRGVHFSGLDKAGASDAPSPEDAAVALQLIDRILALPGRKAAVMLSRLCGESQDDIGDRYGVTGSQICNQERQARAELSERLGVAA